MYDHLFNSINDKFQFFFSKRLNFFPTISFAIAMCGELIALIREKTDKDDIKNKVNRTDKKFRAESGLEPVT